MALQIPTNIKWISVDGSGYVLGSRMEVGPGGDAYRIAWDSRHYTFQVQWRSRRRKSPSFMGTSWNGQEDWDAWGSWQGNDLSGFSTPSTRLPYGLSYTDEEFAFEHDFSDYDKIEYQVRVRAYNEPDGEFSEWGYDTLEIIYIPGDISYPTAVRNADGGVSLVIDTNWPRGGNTVKIGRTASDKKTTKTIGHADSRTVGGEIVTVEVPWSAVKGYSTIYTPNACLYTSDGAFVRLPKYFEVSEYTPPEDFDPPTATFKDENFITVIEVPDDSYKSVTIKATWTDGNGSVVGCEVDVDFDEDSDVWLAEAYRVPFDIPVTYRVTATHALGYYATRKYERTVASRGRHVWTTTDGDSLCLTLDIDYSESYEGNVSTFQAEGCDKPYGRFGTGGDRQINVSGTITNGSLGFDDCTKADIEKLRRKCPWLYRAPEGLVYLVVITSFGYSVIGPRIGSVSISMKEVLEG